jgi:hypothetical protein
MLLSMKKILLVTAIVTLTLNVALWSQTITVTSPSTGNEWCVGSTYSICWTKSGDMPATVDILLRAVGSPATADPVLVIASGEANDGSYPWMIPHSAAPGDYFIRVRTVDAGVVGDGSNFKIISCAARTNHDLKLAGVGSECLRNHFVVRVENNVPTP